MQKYKNMQSKETQTLDNISINDIYSIKEHTKLKNKYTKLKINYENYKLIYSKIDSVYKEIKDAANLKKNDKKTQFMQVWIDDNWKSIMESMADQIYQMADDTWEYSMTESDKESY